MKNKELLNICYKYLNRFINASELVNKLSDINIELYSKKDKKEIDKFILGLEKVIRKYPNKEDSFIINEKKKIKELISKFENIPEKVDDKKTKEYIDKQIKALNKDYERVVDSQDRWIAVSDYITSNKYFNNIFESLTDYEMLEFIAQYISAPFTPNFTQEEFDRLVNVGIDKDEREWLWRLAFNYENRGIKFDLIVDYFILKKDDYYLSELISAVGECLDIDSIIDKISDKELIKGLKERKNVLESFVSEEQYNRLIEKL